MVAYAQGKPADAKPFVDQILASTPDHDVARALQKRLDDLGREDRSDAERRLGLGPP